VTKRVDNPNRTGRPTKYRRRFAAEARKLAFLGATDMDLADFFDVNEVTINAWKNNFPEFLKAIQGAKAAADAQVVKSLYKRALGYTHEEDWVGQYRGEIITAKTEKHYPPDTTACQFWLKNRQPKAWRDRTEVTGPDGQPLIERHIIVLPPNGRTDKTPEDDKGPA
jgi:hypothetical protein